MLKNGNMYTGRVSSISDDYVKIISGTTLTQASSDEIRYVVFENSGEDAIFVNRIDIQGMDNEFIQIIGYSKGMFSNDVTINIDYGQESSYWGKRKQLITDKFGRPIEFYSMIHALNYLTERGWEFVDNYPMSSAQGSAYHYLLRRKKQIKD
jgi:hypothetical protein